MDVLLVEGYDSSDTCIVYKPSKRRRQRRESRNRKGEFYALLPQVGPQFDTHCPGCGRKRKEGEEMAVIVIQLPQR